MEWVIVISLILFGLGLIIVELIFIPGTTVVGILGFIFSTVGVYQAFDKFGNSIGWYVLAATAVISIITIIFSFRTNAWEKLALNRNLEGRLYENRSEGLQVGDVGVALSSLKPIGNGLFEDKEYEVSTLGEYADTQVKIEIIKIESNKIFVKPII